MDESIKMALQRKESTKPRSDEEIVNYYQETNSLPKTVFWYRDCYDVDIAVAKDKVEKVLKKHKVWSDSKSNSKGCMIAILIMVTATSITSLFFL